MIEAQLPAEYRAMAVDHRVIRPNLPAQLGAKITDISQVLRLVFFHVATNSSLRVTTAMGAKTGIVKISPVALHLWMRKIGFYMATLLEVTTDTKETFKAERWAGYARPGRGCVDHNAARRLHDDGARALLPEADDVTSRTDRGN